LYEVCKHLRQKFYILKKTQTQGNAKLKEKLKGKSQNSSRKLKDLANFTPKGLKLTK